MSRPSATAAMILAGRGISDPVTTTGENGIGTPEELLPAVVGGVLDGFASVLR